MSSFETMKQELKAQRELIKQKGGTIMVANDYPSPAEVTAGIQTIETPDFTLATATEEDVVEGKTFFSNSSQLKTGTGLFKSGMMDHLFMVDFNKQTTEDRLYYALPENLTTIRQYCFYSNYNNICIKFNSQLKEIKEYAFYFAKNFSFENFSDATNLKSIAKYAFANASVAGMNFAALPDSVTTIATYAFHNVTNVECSDFRFPSSLTSLANSVYRSDTRREVSSLDMSNYPLAALSDYTFFNNAFNCDIVFPENFQQIKPYCFYNGSCNNVVFPTTLTKLDNYCFYAESSKPLSNFYLETVTFNSAIPPTFGAQVFAKQHLTNGLKIYVPDNAVDQYKAANNFTEYAQYVYPMSQKE